MENIDKILFKLSKSKFRNSFHLKDKDIEYIKEKGLPKIESHALDFINQRLKSPSKIMTLNIAIITTNDSLSKIDS